MYVCNNIFIILYIHIIIIPIIIHNYNIIIIHLYVLFDLFLVIKVDSFFLYPNEH